MRRPYNKVCKEGKGAKMKGQTVGAGIRAMAYHLPLNRQDNQALAHHHPTLNPQKLMAKTGIEARHIAASGELASDLAVAAAQGLFNQAELSPGMIDHLIFCTQAPDYFLPTTAAMIHHRLGLRDDAGSVDINLGCSGFIHGLGLAAGLIGTGQADRVLLLTADTYSKFIADDDISTRSIFGDAGAAVVVEAGHGVLGPFQYGTDGGGAANLIVATGGLRQPSEQADGSYRNAIGERRAGAPLFMNGPEIFNFTLGAVPKAMTAVLTKAGLTIDAVDLFVFHQANAMMLEALRRKMGLPVDKFFVSLSETGNTVSSTIPIALCQAVASGRLRPGHRVLSIGFGVGYTWAATVMEWGASSTDAG